MLSAEDNSLLTRTGPETTMGALLRRYWIPALLSEELPETNGRPVRVRLLSENLVAFRNSDGAVGLLEEQCPHRRTSLGLAVNADNGLRCLYHGWKFDVNGQCVDMPAEPESSTMCARIRARAYPTVEAGGVIWAYMGPEVDKPAFPHFEWLGFAPANVSAFKVLAECNYAQVMEGTIDSAHAGILHRESPWGEKAKYPHEKDLKPKLEIEFTQYGLRYGAVRTLSDADRHVRVTQVVLPFMTLIPPDGAGVRKHRRMANAFVPRDDYSTWHIQWFFDDTQVVDRAFRIEEGGHWLVDGYRKELNIDNWYGQDRDMMRSTNMSGIRGILVQDHAVSETQGVILDRSQEHLGTSDLAVVAWRRLMLRTARELESQGRAPPMTSAPMPWQAIRGETVIYTSDKSWKDVVPLQQEFSVDTNAV